MVERRFRIAVAHVHGHTTGTAKGRGDFVATIFTGVDISLLVITGNTTRTAAIHSLRSFRRTATALEFVINGRIACIGGTLYAVKAATNLRA